MSGHGVVRTEAAAGGEGGLSASFLGKKLPTMEMEGRVSTCFFMGFYFSVRGFSCF